MAITNTVMISRSSNMEYGLVLSHPNGVTEIMHLDKDFEQLDKEVLQYIDARFNPVANGRHYFVCEKAENKPKIDVSIVEIAPNQTAAGYKWDALTFQDAYLDFHHGFRFHPGAVQRNVGFSFRPSLVTFESFIKFVAKCYKADYDKWKMVDSDLAWVRKTFAIPTLK